MNYILFCFETLFLFGINIHIIPGKPNKSAVCIRECAEVIVGKTKEIGV